MIVPEIFIHWLDTLHVSIYPLCVFDVAVQLRDRVQDQEIDICLKGLAI